MSDKSFNDAHTSTVHEDTMCSVVPLRLGIFLVAVFTVIWATCSLLFSGFAESMVYFTGGYCLKTRIALGFMEVTGIIFGICGAIGAWGCKKDYVLTFNCWQVVRILVFAYIYWVDVPLLNSCESWVNDVDSMIAKYGWNDLMYKVAMAAVCNQERDRFWVGSIITFLFLVYVTWCTHRYLEEVGKTPKHLLRIPKDLTSGAWYAHALGEKNHMNDSWGSARPPMPAQQESYGSAMPQGGPQGRPRAEATAFAV